MTLPLPPSRQRPAGLKAVALLTLLLLSPLVSCREEVVVTHVFDGDTIAIGKRSVRLIGVNTPEMEWKEKGHRQECFAAEAKKALEDFVLRRKISLVSDSIGDRRDRYNRELFYVYLDDQLINEEMIAEGYGFALSYFPFKKKDEFLKREKEARKSQRGLWGHCGVDCKRGYCKTTQP